LLRVELIRDTCSADVVASLYAVSRRTLYRYLKAEGRTFRQVANGFRRKPFVSEFQLLEWRS
jgi:hypothetical protein